MQGDVKPAAPAHEAADALSAVVNSATAVARAEVQLVKAEARAWLTRIGWGLLLLWLSMFLLQGFVLLLALTPVLAQGHGWQTWGLTLSLSAVPTVGVCLLAARELKRLKELGNGTNAHRDQ